MSSLTAPPPPHVEPEPFESPSLPAPRWIAWVIALVPVFPPLYLAAFWTLPSLRGSSRSARNALLLCAALQIAAALFTPRPLESLALAALRLLFFAAMIAAGLYLKESRHLRPLVWGYASVFAVAWGYEFLTHGTSRLLEARLSHPFYYTVSLGLIAVTTLWLLVSWKGAAPWWRLGLGAAALVTLVATGSRGPFLALAVGAAAAVLVGNLRYLRALGVTVLIVVAALGLVPGLRQFALVERFANGTLSGRDQVWQGALQAFGDSPIGGQGPYQIGPYIKFLYDDQCVVTAALADVGMTCPTWLEPYRGVWLTAHNVFLHSLAETGVLGTLGLLVLLVFAARAVWRTRDGLLVSIFFGYLGISLVDVVTVGPSPHFAELFWLVVGMAFARTAPTPSPRTAVNAPAATP
ncbi:O-antigen ligase family protein [Deinococcus yavapaiensis]|uniref:O-antigen ligase family protein n=1 Tax=Deinococcus yavapaiensis TaxID=309889 RepID=UPI001FE270EB|nr:O-antigen ligase family protein [Deinococcus yavapaiensis]